MGPRTHMKINELAWMQLTKEFKNMKPFLSSFFLLSPHFSMASTASSCSDMDEPESPTISSVSYDLQDLVEQYKSQPELLKLILTSKVEEDKRRAEEARLRAKELDFYLHHQRRCSSSSQSSCEYFQPYPTSSIRRRHAAEDRRRRNSAAAAMIAMGNQTASAAAASSPSPPPHHLQSPSR